MTAPEGPVRPRAFKYQPKPKNGSKPPESRKLEPGGRDSGEPRAAASEPEEQEDDSYKIVKVFYGTDRAAESALPWTRLGAISWGYLALAAFVVAFGFLIIRLITKSRFSMVLFYVCMLAAIGLGICNLVIPRTIKPRDIQLAKTYGNQCGTLEVGTCEASIPATHEVGELERPSVFRFEFNEDPTRHMMLMSVNQEKPERFFNELKQQVAKSAERQTFVFIHGYNVTFENAALRTAQLKYDLKFDGPAIFYSWPSQGGLLQYTVDETNVEWTVPHLEEFLTDIVKKTGAKQIHLIAHSMGNRALTSALERLSRRLEPDNTPIFNEVILAAPDIDAEIFRRDIAPAIVKTARRVTLYASSNDRALAASKTVHGYPRAGESGENIVIVDGIDTIDVSDINTSMLGHDYYIKVIGQLLQESKFRGLRSRLREVARNGRKHWEFLTDDTRQP